MHANNSSMPQQWVLLPLCAHTVTDIICWNTACVASPMAQCSAIDLMKRKEAIVLREEWATRAFSSIPALSPRSFLSPVIAFNGLWMQSSGERRGTTISCQEEERTCKITRRSLGARELARIPRERSRYAPPPAVACLWCALSSASRRRAHLAIH